MLKWHDNNEQRYGGIMVITMEPSVALTIKPSVALTTEPSVAMTIEPSVALTTEPSVVITRLIPSQWLPGSSYWCPWQRTLTLSSPSGFGHQQWVLPGGALRPSALSGRQWFAAACCKHVFIFVRLPGCKRECTAIFTGLPKYTVQRSLYVAKLVFLHHQIIYFQIF